MVFTEPVHSGGRARRYAGSPPTARAGTLTRRQALAGLGGAGTALALGGCDWFGGGGRRTPDALEPLLTGTRDLVRRYDTALAAAPALAATLTPIRDNHRAHADALARLIGPAAPKAGPSGSAASPPPPATTPSAVVTDLIAAEDKAHRDAVAACLAAPAARAATLGSIAACRATHVEALR